jgi:hypothetical protein
VSSVRVCMWLSHPAPLAVSLRGGRTATGAARMRCSTSCASTPPQCLSPTHAAAHYHALVMPHTHTHTYAHTPYRRAKYELQHLVRVNLAGQDTAYRCVYQMEDENGASRAPAPARGGTRALRGVERSACVCLPLLRGRGAEGHVRGHARHATQCQSSQHLPPPPPGPHTHTHTRTLTHVNLCVLPPRQASWVCA